MWFVLQRSLYVWHLDAGERASPFHQARKRHRSLMPPVVWSTSRCQAMLMDISSIGRCMVLNR